MGERVSLTAAELERRLLYRDGLVLIIDKPAGLPVHKGPKAVTASTLTCPRSASACPLRRR